MSAYLYDEAIVDNLRRVIGDDRISIGTTDDVFNIIPRIADDTVKLPLITLRRSSWQINAENASHAAKYEGELSNIIQEEEPKVQRVQVMPMRLTYALDVWTKTREENDEFIRQLFWYFAISPTMSIKVPYSLDFDHNFNLYAESDVIDNSDISEHKNRGQYYRQTMSLWTDDAKLWKSSSRPFTKVDIITEFKYQGIEEASKSTQTASK